MNTITVNKVGSFGNMSRAIIFIIASVLLLLFFTQLYRGNIRFSDTSENMAAVGLSADFNASLNPTGDPIGGGIGYSQIVRTGDHQPKSPVEFLSLMQEYKKETSGGWETVVPTSPAASGETIYINGSYVWDMTGYKDITIPSGVTIASDRGYRSGKRASQGALLFSDTIHYNETVGESALFLTGGEGIRITGLRIKGPAQAISPINSSAAFKKYGLALGIKAQNGHDNFELDNNELYHWDAWAILIYEALDVDVHHNFIHHMRFNGFGYGIWLRGDSSRPAPQGDAIPLVEANLFDAHKHAVASDGGGKGSWIARYNYVIQHSGEQKFDRHETSGGATAGYYTEANANLFFGREGDSCDLGGNSGRLPVDTFVFSNNWSDWASLGGSTSQAAVCDLDFLVSKNKIITSGNRLNGEHRANLPVGSVSVNNPKGTSVPHTVTFNAGGSSDPHGVPINAYRWIPAFDEEEIITPGPTFSRTYDRIGTFTEYIYPRNRYGMLSADVPADVVVTVSKSPMADYLVGYWNMEKSGGELKDSHSALDFDNADGQQAAGIVGGATQFSGGGASFEENALKKTQQLDIGTSDISAAFWVYIDDRTERFEGIFGNGGGSGGGKNAGWMVFRDGKRLRVWFASDEGRTPRDIGLISPGKWHFVAFTADRDGEFKGYVTEASAGSVVNTESAPDVPWPDKMIWSLNQDFEIANNYVTRLHGRLDEVAIWKRVLTADEISWLYNSGQGRAYSELAQQSTPVPEPEPQPNTPPTVSLSISPTQYVTPASITMTATASDTNGSITKVEFFNGSTKIGGDTTAPYTYTWNQSAVGTYDISAKATDSGGLTTVTTKTTLVVKKPQPQDTDNDGIVDTADLCPDTPVAHKNRVNQRGCPLPLLSRFDIKPDLSTKDLRGLTGVILGITGKGRINFGNASLNLIKADRKNPLDLDTHVSIGTHRVSIDADALPELNKPATITLEGVTVENPRIMRDGVECTECTITSYTDGTLVFTVPGFSVYTIEEEPQEEPSGEEESGGGSGGGGGGGSSESSSSSGGGGGGGGSSSGGSSSGSFAAPAEESSESLTRVQMIARIQELLSLIQELRARLIQQGVTPSTPSASSCTFTRSLTIGSRGTDVTCLQKYLQGTGHFTYPGGATGYFGPVTQSAVASWQRANSIFPPQGYFGPISRSAYVRLSGN